jgi:hypothetical protein
MALQAQPLERIMHKQLLLMALILNVRPELQPTQLSQPRDHQLLGIVMESMGEQTADLILLPELWLVLAEQLKADNIILNQQAQLFALLVQPLLRFILLTLGSGLVVDSKAEQQRADAMLIRK